MRRMLLVIVVMAVFTNINAGQVSPDKYTVFTGSGESTDIAAIIKNIGEHDVIFLGELHDDSVGHALQFEIFKASFERYRANRRVALSLEMFERDVQPVLDEYLQGLITEQHFLQSSRPWGNYQTDYRPLVELARENNLSVIAANAPRRYVNMVSRLGRDSLNKLSPEAEKWLAPLPFGQASPAYADKFNALMGGHGNANILDSQALWDATMSYSIARYLKKNKQALVIHLNGGFHTENRLGTVEHLLKYRGRTSVLVVTMKYEEEFRKFDESKHSGLGDFVILTDAAQPRSKR